MSELLIDAGFALLVAVVAAGWRAWTRANLLRRPKAAPREIKSST